TNGLSLDGTVVTATAAELNKIDGGTSATGTTVADADRVVLNDNGTMVQVAVTDIDTYISTTSKTLTNKTLTSPTINTPTITGNTTFSDGSYNFNVASHDGTNGLSLAGTVVTATAAELNKIDGGTSATSTTVADADRVVFNDNGTMVQVAVTDLAAYYDGKITAMPNLVTTAATTVGALNSGSITSGFGTINNGSSAITTTGTVTYGTLNDGTTSLTATTAELNAAADIDARVENVTSTNTITVAESGKTFFLNSGTEFVSTLPAPAAGLEYTFIIKAAPASASYEIKTNGDTDILIGLVTCATSDDLGANDDNADVITFVDGQAVVGDWVRVVSDGTSWYFSGACKVAEGITTGTS
ncbi:MAG: hypothetical protein QF780_03225, partial [Candidatus Marinimicrobia bacterium]|nr:hypothetical protein [Candidatus Neomarinimicrobiota bacterium]